MSYLITLTEHLNCHLVSHTSLLNGSLSLSSTHESDFGPVLKAAAHPKGKPYLSEQIK
jgi:hypothetical protein